jgi:hypothetical protein
MIKWIIGGLLFVGFVFSSVDLFLPKDFEIVRKTVIEAHPARVLGQLESLDRWATWWPWTRHAEVEVGEQAANPGATLSWKGRPASGKLVLTKTSIFEITFDLFFDANSRPDSGAFLIRNVPGGTELTWKVNAHYEIPFVGGYLALIADPMHGGMLSWGLRRIRERAEEDRADLYFSYLDDRGNEVEEKIP